MAYIIRNNDGNVITMLADRQVDSESTSLSLIGKNVDNYGEYFNNNLIKLLTNFASTTSPISPQIGQLWYDKTSKKLTVFNGVGFVSAYGTHVAGTQPITTSTGDLWYDTVNGQLNIWDGFKFNLIAPEVSKIYGKTGIGIPTSTILSAGTNIPQKISIINSYGSPTAFITTSAFVMSTSSSVLYLGATSATQVVSGLTLFNDLEIKGNMYLGGNVMTPIKTLSTVYNITPFGNPQDPVASTSTRNTSIANGNNAIRFDLKKVFPVQTISTLSQVAYALGSEVRVVCFYNADTSVRRFRLEEIIPGNPNWEPMNLYYNTWTTVNNNIVI